MASPYYEIVNVEVKVADLAGKVRAETGMRLPDAILVASALTREAYALVTHDDELKRAERLLKVMSAKELIGEMGRA